MNDTAAELKFLCYLDILGFEKRIAEVEFKKAYEYIIKEVIEPYQYEDKVYLISDSVVVLSENFSELVKNSFSIYTSALLVNIFLRGAITKGKINNLPMVHERSNKIVIPYLGEAYLKAYKLEKSINSAGICIDHEAYDELQDDEKDLFFSYKEPFPKDDNKGEKHFLISDTKGSWSDPQSILSTISVQITDRSPDNLIKLINTFCLYYKAMKEKHGDKNNLETYHKWWIDILNKL